LSPDIDADKIGRFLTWMLSFLFEVVAERLLAGERLFWTVFWKDTVCALSNIAIIVVVQWGILNRPACWSIWGTTGLYLPQMPEVTRELMYFIRQVAPGIVFAALMFHFFFCVAVICRYWDAVRVFVQRDDGLSNISWITDGWAWLRGLFTRER
jgi:hypothetical protein